MLDLDAIPKLTKADWTVLDIPSHAEAVALIEALHYAKGAPNTSTFRHGLYKTATAPLYGYAWGVALWIPPTKVAALTVAENWQGVLALSRFVLDPSVPPNGASYLLGRSMRLVDRERWPVLLTYADTAHGHTGAIYKATNWECLGPVPAGDVWVDGAGVQRGRKRGGHTLRRAEMIALGFTQVKQEPKIKYVQRAA